jgi:hypothetical protein
MIRKLFTIESPGECIALAIAILMIIIFIFSLSNSRTNSEIQINRSPSHYSGIDRVGDRGMAGDYAGG